MVSDSMLGGASFGNLMDGRYLVPCGYPSPSVGEIGATIVMPFSATLKNFYVTLDVAPGAGNSWTLTIRKNQASTALTITISGSDDTGNDTTHTVSVAAGDKISILITATGSPSPSGAQWGFQVSV